MCGCGCELALVIAEVGVAQAHVRAAHTSEENSLSRRGGSKWVGMPMWFVRRLVRSIAGRRAAR
jgi:hypothetical protein